MARQLPRRGSDRIASIGVRYTTAERTAAVVAIAGGFSSATGEAPRDAKRAVRFPPRSP